MLFYRLSKPIWPDCQSIYFRIHISLIYFFVSGVRFTLNIGYNVLFYDFAIPRLFWLPTIPLPASYFRSLIVIYHYCFDRITFSLYRQQPIIRFSFFVFTLLIFSIFHL